MHISVVIPTYNYGRFLQRAVNSVLIQTPQIDVIVVDDGSTDDSRVVMESVLRQNAGARLRYVRQQNAGPSAARNHGVSLAEGDWIAFLDADDYWYPHKLTSQLDFAARHPGGALYFSGIDLEDVDGLRRRKLPPKNGAVTWNELVEDNVIPSPTPLVNKDVFMRAGRFNENRRYAEDWDLWLRVLEIGPAYGQRQALACYVDHGSGLHRNTKMLEASWLVLEEALNRRPWEELPPGLTNRVRAAMVGSSAFLAVEQRDYRKMFERASRAIRMDVHQAPRMAWCGLYSFLHRSL